MPKYRNPKHQEIEEEIDGYSEGTPQEPEIDLEKEKTFEKRYGDLRSYTDRIKREHQEQMNELKQQLNELSSQGKGPKLPKSAEELAEFKDRYPDAFDTFVTLARQEIEGVASNIHEQLEAIKERELEIKKREARDELLQLHPDFEELVKDQDFHDWLSLQDQEDQDALYKNDTNVRKASKVIKLYKAENNKPKKRNTSEARDAAMGVGRSSGSEPKASTKGKWTLSKINALTPQEYDKYEDEIDEAYRKGEVVMDVKEAAF